MRVFSLRFKLAGNNVGGDRSSHHKEKGSFHFVVLATLIFVARLSLTYTGKLLYIRDRNRYHRELSKAG